MPVRIGNLVALGRVALLPVIVYLILQSGSESYLWAIVLLFIAFVSEFFDPYFKNNDEVGSSLAPFSHKIFIIGLLFIFFLQGKFHVLFFTIFIIRDIAIAWIKWSAARDDAIVRSDYFSIATTYLQFGIIFSILFFEMFSFTSKWGAFFTDKLTLIFIVFAVVTAILSIVHNGSVYLNKLGRRMKVGKEIEKENLVVLVNKQSTGYRNVYRRRLLKLFVQRRKAKIIYLPKKKEMYNSVDVRKYDHIIIAGGDGSFESALNYKLFQNKSLGFFPLGAGNAFYSYFYKGKRFEYLRSRFPFREVEMDVLEMEWDHGKVQTMFCTIGVDAEVIKLSKTEGNKSGFWHYFNASLEALFTLKPSYNLKLSVEKRKINWDNTVNFTIGKVPYYGFGVRSLLGKMLPSDGHILGLAVVNTHSAIFNKPLRIWALLLSMTGIYKAPLVAVKGKEMVLESDKKFPIQVGGDFLGYSKKVTVRVVRKQKVLMI